MLLSNPSENSDKVAPAALAKWVELGPLTLAEIAAKADSEFLTQSPFAEHKADDYSIGQLEGTARNGICRYINSSGWIFEGQCKNDDLNGFGRVIFSYGEYYIGYWLDGSYHGQGKEVRADGKVREGKWEKYGFKG